MAWCGAQGRAAAGWRISLPSHHFKIESSYTNLYGFLLWPLFLLSILHACLFFILGLPVFPLLLLHPAMREREIVTSPMTPFFFSLLSFHSFFPSPPPPPPPPLFLSASLNSPSLIQLPGRRDSACSDCFTPHGPPSPSGSPLLR